MPVLPAVGSIIVPPGFSLPDFSASRIKANPMRSLTLPPGLKYSSLAKRETPSGKANRLIRIIGVQPINSFTSSTIRFTIHNLPHHLIMFCKGKKRNPAASAHRLPTGPMYGKIDTEYPLENRRFLRSGFRFDAGRSRETIRTCAFLERSDV